MERRPTAEIEEIARAPDEVSLETLTGLATRLAGQLESANAPAPRELREAAWNLLDVVRRPAVLRKIADADRTSEWSDRILGLVDGSDLTPGVLFHRRAAAYGSKVLFELPGRSVTWRQAAARVDSAARGLLSVFGESAPGRVAILSENRLEMAVVDLACMRAGIVSVMIPANATDADVKYMLEHARVAGVIVSTREQLAKVLPHRESLPSLRHVIVLDALANAGPGITPLADVLANAGNVRPATLEERCNSIRSEDLASVMYTSGTTGEPKGTMFSNRNIVFKRFARALALPEIGENDVFLCYLPLFHTFGRYLELQGCVFWGSKYCFLENPSAEALVEGMRRYRPTVFISVPRKWIQLHEAIVRQADPDTATDEEVARATTLTTGGRLRRGLSAAGYLDPEIFRFFQRHGIELMSGFGMTEATGGITMTRPGDYREDSLGPALPGIEMRLLDDGELCVRGPYVMMGYLDAHDSDTFLDEDGWLHTGDLMEMDRDGHIKLVDRKKEIYKNINGETIAPQRVESLFRDFDSVGTVFLVGDHRAYNTALIYPNPEYRDVDLRAMTPEERKIHFRSVVTSVNRFLSPFERIVDFAVIDRDLDPELGELTPKGTPRRKTVERNFQSTIRLLYRRTHLKVGGLDVIFPNWLFQALGLTAQDLQIGDDKISIPAGGSSLVVRRLQKGTALIGSGKYGYERGPINLGLLLATPRLWLGNEDLVRFAGLDVSRRERPGRAAKGIEWKGRVVPLDADAGRGELEAAATRDAHDLMDLHHAALQLASPHPEGAGVAVKFLARALAEEETPLAEPARVVLRRAASSPSLDVRRQAFRVLVSAETDGRFESTLRAFLAAPGVLLDDTTRAALVDVNLSDAKLDALLRATEEAAGGASANQGKERQANALLQLIAEFGSAHPARYRQLRAFLVHLSLFAERETTCRSAAKAASSLDGGFRRWLGPPIRVAVDPDTGQEYRWHDVVDFEDRVDPGDRERLLDAMQTTMFLREAVFLFSRSAFIRLSDIPPGGVWVRLLGDRHGKRVYRITVQTRYQGTYDLAVNVNHGMTPEEVREEIHTLILCGESRAGGEPLVEDFGGFWSEQDLWSEEFIAGETLHRALARLARPPDELDRFRHTWPFLAWSAMHAYVDFWRRSGKRWEVSDPGMTNVIVPTHDYHTGARIISVSNRKPHVGVIPMLAAFREELVNVAERQYPALEGIVGWDPVFSSLLGVFGEQEGLRLLLGAQKREGASAPEDLLDALRNFTTRVEERGFLPKRLYFAAERYRRWAGLSLEPTREARARTLRELFETYGLQTLAQTYPETRVRFFRETVFRDAPAALVEGLEGIIAKLRRREIVGDAVIDAISDLRARLDLGRDDDYFLARLSFPHLRPEDSAGFVEADFGGKHQSEMVVVLEDQDGSRYRVRHALNPREVGRLHRLFLSAKLDVRFRPEHRFLVALSDRQQIIGGIYYEIEEENRAAHLEKIVVAERYRKKGVADGLMNEFFHRLRAWGVSTATTGFFRPDYFSSYGFRVDKRYGGQVKNLDST